MVDRGYLDEAKTRLQRVLSLAVGDQQIYQVRARQRFGDVQVSAGRSGGCPEII